MFNIGDYVYVAELETITEYEPCPVCYGNKLVVLILGNGEQVQLQCEFCRVGCNPPSGVIAVKDRYVGSARFQKITGFDNREGSITYWFGGWGCREDRVAATEAEAIQLGEIWAEKLRIEDEQRRENMVKHNLNRSYSWNAGHYRKMATQSYRDYDRYSQLAQAMQEKARQKEIE